MRLVRALRTAALLVAAPLVWGVAPSAFAAGTPSGTTVTNEATLQYSVNSVGQPDITSLQSTFLVDNRIDHTVTWQDAASIGALSPQAVGNFSVLTFNVQNDGNTAQDYRLLPPTENQNQFPAGYTVVVETNGTPGYQPGDTDTFIDELAPDANIDVYLLVDNVPAGETVNDENLINVIAQAADAGGAGALGADVTDHSAAADDPNVVQNVFADGGGTDPGDAANDAQHSDEGSAVIVDAPTVTIAKTATVVMDPVALVTGDQPKAIPGAWVRYDITISHTVGTVSATLTGLTDALVVTTAIDPNLLDAGGNPENVAGTGFKVVHTSARPTTPATQFFTTASDADGVEHDGTNPGGNISTTWAAVLPVEAGYAAGELKPGESVTLTFNVLIQ